MLVIKIKNICKRYFAILLFLLCFIFIHLSSVEARHFEPGEFQTTGIIDDTTGNLKNESISNQEIRFADKETGRIVYSRTYDNSTWYPINYFSPDGRTLYLLWQAQHSNPGQIAKQIELIDIYNNCLIKRYDVIYEQIWYVAFSPCSNIAGITICSLSAGRWNINYSFVDLKTYSIIKEGSLSSRCTPPIAFITADGRNIRLSTCDSGDVGIFPLPDPVATISNDPDPVMPAVTVITEGLIEGSVVYKAFRYLSSLAKKTLDKIFQPATFPVIKYGVRVIGSDKRTISGLGSGSFQMKENGIAQTITNLEFQSSNVPVDIALCLDTSGSITDSELSQVNAAAGKFIDYFSSADRGAIYKFSNNVTLSQSLTSDKAVLKNAINASALERGMTSLNDAVYDAITLCRQSQNRQAVVAITDGYDNDSGHSLQQVIDYSLENKIPVFTIGLGSPLNVSLLQTMAAECRGVYFNAITINKLEEVFNKVAEDIRSRYVITYVTSNSAKDGTTRNVETTAVTGGGSDSSTFQYRAPQGIRPTAQIISISPNPCVLNQPVSFSGTGVDSDGSIVEYNWRSSINGVIGNQETFQSSSLSEGNHTIYFKVKDSDGLWSNEVSTGLTVLNKATISGRIRYENRIFNETGTGQPNATEFKPVRFAKIEIIRDADGSPLGTSETKADGTYALRIENVFNDRIRLKCFTQQDNANYKIIVLPGDPEPAYFSLSDVKTVDVDNLAIDFDISQASGNAGAFNIFDTLIQGSDKVKELSGSAPPLIRVYWQKGVALGTGYNNNIIELNGSSDDADEYDDCVILHEYGHFIADKYSYNKSPAEAHQANDTNQDIRLSWSEGWATYYMGMTRNSALYIDTDKDDEGNFRYRTLNIETLYHSRYGSLLTIATGQDTEVAVSSILWDIYDSADDTGDTLTLGAQSIWNVFRSFNSAYDCVLEDFYNNFINNPANEIYLNQINNIFAERKVFYSSPLFKRGRIFIKDDGRPIPNGTGAGLSSTVSITDNLSIQNLNVFVDIAYNHKSDLLVKLISPSNKEVILHNHTSPQSGQSQDIFAWYQPPYETIPDGNLAGTGQDLTALDIFKDDNGQGNWILNVTDASNLQTGFLNRWKLEILENQAPEFEPIGDKAVDEGKLLEFNISANNPHNKTLTYSATALPQGAYFSPERRLFSWLPNYNQQGEYLVHFEVSDGSLKDAQDVKIIVNDVTINPVSGKSISVGLKVRVVP